MSGTGFISRGGFFGIGQLSVSHGLGGFGTMPYPPLPPPVPADHILAGAGVPGAMSASRGEPRIMAYMSAARKPRAGTPIAAATSRNEPRFIVHIPVAKKK